MKNDSIWLANTTHREKYAYAYAWKKDEEYKDREIRVWKNLWDIKVGKVAGRRIPSFYSRTQPFYTFRAVSVHLTLLLFLTSTLFAPFISHLAGYCDKRITRFSPRENVFLSLYYTTRERKLEILNWKSRRASCTGFSRSALTTFSRPVRFLSQDPSSAPPPLSPLYQIV